VELQLPSLAQLRGIAAQYGFHLTDGDLESFRGLMSGSLQSYQRVAELDEPTLPVRYPRSSGYRPPPSENPLNAWYWKSSIKGAPDGPLSGKRIAVKDNMCVAGVPMMNGSFVLEGYVPEFDATVVTRVLDAGGEIVGKAVCEHMSFGGSSFTSDTGPVRNPYDSLRSSGGSSSGAAALVASGECDMALAADQGGSIRIPSSWCGVFGLKPTYGLVPYTGVSPVELTQDHAGPIAANVADIAQLLQVIAGEDGLDPRQRNVRVGNYTEALQSDVRGLRIGLLAEGFNWPDRSDRRVDEAVRSAVGGLAALGAEVLDISIPMHRDGTDIWKVIAVEGRTVLMVRGRGMGTNWKGHYSVSLLDAYARGMTERADDLSDNVKMVVLLGQHMQDAYHGRFYARAQNLARVLGAAYDAALESVDVLCMPTAPMLPTLLPAPDASREERAVRSLEMGVNTGPFNTTGHPALSAPCGIIDGLPVGVMLVTRPWHEETLLRVARAFELSVPRRAPREAQ
jgi:amidase